jgi:cyclopropane-fatty-acyl-phospholipid synthase
MKATVRTNFDESAGAYAAYEAATGQFSTLAARLATEMAGRDDGSLGCLLDAGAGTGASATPLESKSETVVPLDMSRAMLVQHPSARRVQGDFDALPFPAGSFDAVAFTASLFLTPSPATALGEARRVLSDGGVVGAVAPEGWYIDGTDVFQQVDRESRSPSSTTAVREAFEETVDTVSGTWGLEVTAEQLRQFYQIPAVAARVYPRLAPEARVERVETLLADIEGTGEQRWRWMVGQ